MTNRRPHDVRPAFGSRLRQPPTWSLVVANESDEEFLRLVLEAFKAIYAAHFIDDHWIVNHNLPIDVRALRQTDPWRIALVLTPWMLARVFSPLREPNIALPKGWRANERSEASYTVIGPPVVFSVLGQRQTAYLNHHPQLGHYIIQPLIQSMQRYPSAEAVYEAWSEVIRRRDETMRNRQLECNWQNEVSRREFFTGFRRHRDREAH
jgi:hypothetical protein